MSKLVIYLVLLICLSCNHPESNNFSRDKKSRKEFVINSEKEKVNKLDMEVENGVRYVWIEVNGIRLRFIFDTGASNICISPIEASVLSTQYFQDATGRISEGTKINLRLIKIGNVELKNVEATVIDNVNAPLLLGQTVLERFGSIEIDNDNNLIILK